MIIYPAIDLRQGKCIRLMQGDFQRETVYDTDPAMKIKNFIAAGANWLHLVDLDGALNPNNTQEPMIAGLLKNSEINIQTGGGIRTQEQIFKLLEFGAARVILGSVAVENSQEVVNWLNIFGVDRLCIALDVTYNKNKELKVVSNAWQTITSYSLDELLEFYQVAGLKHVICTNITRDGTLNGPDYDLYENLLKQYPSFNFQASGGIQSLTDISSLKEKKMAGAIVGRALYENKFTLQEALSC